MKTVELKIRENTEQHMQELKQWLLEIADSGPEEMSAFFTARIDGYEEHMSVWQPAYQRFAQLLPADSRSILDLGCGTGLELDEIFKRYPDAKVFGIDLCQDMLDRLQQKHGHRNLETVCADYCQYNFGSEKWDSVISFESLHHFLPDRKRQLYGKIYDALKKGGVFLLGDYIACCEEEEQLLRQVYADKREKFKIPDSQFIHFDIPLTLEHETGLLQDAGFASITAADSINGATIVYAVK